jgi:superfamily II DNA or RNA helicase
MSLFQGEFPSLHDFQAKAHESIRLAVAESLKAQRERKEKREAEALTRGPETEESKAKREAVEAEENYQDMCRVLVMAPTGAGKTILALNVVKNLEDVNEKIDEENAKVEKANRKRHKRRKRAMFLCDRKTLISQTSEVARAVGLGHHGIIQAQNPMYDITRSFQIASCQTLMRRGWPEDMDVIIIDEAHAQYKTWVDYIKSKQCKAIVIGLSATPFSPGMGKVFNRLVNAATMHELTGKGILVPMRIFSCRKPDMAGAATAGGEWTDKAAEERELVIVGDVITEWTRLAYGLKTIVFGSTIKHCEELTRQFNEAGIPAATFCADTEDDDRARILLGFQDGDIKVLVSVEALAKGFDVKDIGCVCDCRPLRKSLSTAIQMWGRGLRASTETGKTECILLDFSGNIIRFADDFSKIFYEGLSKLDDGEKLDKEIRKDEGKEPKSCPKCGYSPMGGKKCVGCGFVVPEKSSLVEHLPGEMAEVVLGGKKLAPDQIHLYAQIATYAREHSSPEKQNGRAAHLFKDITGQWPPRAYNVQSAPTVEPTRNTLNKIRSMQIAFAHRRTKA